MVSYCVVYNPAYLANPKSAESSQHSATLLEKLQTRSLIFLDLQH